MILSNSLKSIYMQRGGVYIKSYTA